MTVQNNNNNTKGLVYSIVIHGLLFLAALFFYINIPFPKEETEYYFGDFGPSDIFENHPLIDMSFPRIKTETARCGFRKWLITLKPNEKIIYSGAVYVVCRH